MSKIGKKGKQLKKRHTSKRMRLKKFKKKQPQFPTYAI